MTTLKQLKAQLPVDQYQHAAIEVNLFKDHLNKDKIARNWLKISHDKTKKYHIVTVKYRTKHRYLPNIISAEHTSKFNVKPDNTLEKI